MSEKQELSFNYVLDMYMLEVRYFQDSNPENFIAVHLNNGDIIQIFPNGDISK